MNLTEAKGILLGNERKEARATVITAIMKHSELLKRNHSRALLHEESDMQLLTTLIRMEKEFKESIRLPKTGAIIMILAIMLASCFAGCSSSHYISKAEKHPVGRTYNHPCVKNL